MKGSISRKISIVIISVLTISFFIVFTIMLISSESTMTEEAEKTVNDVNSLISNSVIFGMNEGATSVEPYFDMLKDIPELVETRLIPSNQIRDDDSENRLDTQEASVFKSGAAVFNQEVFQNQRVIRAIRTIDALESCTDCHDVAIGDPLAVLSTRYTIEPVRSAIASQRLFAFFGALLTILISFALIKFMLEKQVLGRLKLFVQKIVNLAKGDIRGEISCSGNDELSRAGDSIIMLQTALLDKVHVAEEIANGNLTTQLEGAATKAIRSDQDELSKSLSEMVKMLRELFSSISGDSSSMMTTSQELKEISGKMSQEAATLKTKSETVSLAATEMNKNIDSISVSTSEMSSTVSEISGNTEKTRQITAQAVDLTKKTEKKIDNLNAEATEIHNVVAMITDIAEQTKLLALNATIEAARAGEAGKGFAVVAGEVKDLAHQTNNATTEIKSKIDGIQNSTAEAVQEVGQINKIITEINELVNMIATAVEEQNVTTHNIADNIKQTAELSESVVQDVANMNQAVTNVKDASDQTDESASSVFTMGSDLEQMVKRVKL